MIEAGYTELNKHGDPWKLSEHHPSHTLADGRLASRFFIVIRVQLERGSAARGQEASILPFLPNKFDFDDEATPPLGRSFRRGVKGPSRHRINRPGEGRARSGSIAQCRTSRFGIRQGSEVGASRCSARWRLQTMSRDPQCGQRSRASRRESGNARPRVQTSVSRSSSFR
jgi:hypothetical protein